jgi:hypothetical protein
VQPEFTDDRQVGRALDSLGDDGRADVEGEREECADGNTPGVVVGDPVDQRTVDLDEVGSQLEDVAQRREACAGIVDGDAQALPAQGRELRRKAARGPSRSPRAAHPPAASPRAADGVVTRSAARHTGPAPD